MKSPRSSGGQNAARASGTHFAVVHNGSRQASWMSKATSGTLTRRRLLQGSALALTGWATYHFTLRDDTPRSQARGRVLVVGGGAAGLSIASRLRRALPNAQISLIDPAGKHYYQPGFTLIAAGVFTPDEV